MEEVKQELIESGGLWCGDSVALSGRFHTTTSGNDGEGERSGFSSKRRTAVERDNGACQLCENESPLEVHHIERVEHGGTHELENLVTLCRVCHKIFGRLPSENQRTVLKNLDN